MQTITVTVSGKPGSGKSTIAQVIKDALDIAGIESRLEDEDGVPLASTFTKRIEAIGGFAKVRIRQEQECRVGTPNVGSMGWGQDF
jgi:deoxyadenosine/deoxycytidine kinase